MLSVDIPYEVTDAIVVAELKSFRDTNMQLIKDASEKIGWHHPDDITKYGQVIMAIDILLGQYLTHSEKKEFL